MERNNAKQRAKRSLEELKKWVATFLQLFFLSAFLSQQIALLRARVCARSLSLYLCEENVYFGHFPPIHDVFLYSLLFEVTPSLLSKSLKKVPSLPKSLLLKSLLSKPLLSKSLLSKSLFWKSLFIELLFLLLLLLLLQELLSKSLSLKSLY